MPDLRLLPLAVGCAALVAACGSAAKPVDPATLVTQAKATVDAARSVHFELTSADAKGSGIIVVGGTGDAGRPDQLQGSFTVSDSGLPVTVKVLATGGVFYAQLPFAPGYTKTDPTTYGIGDPSTLLDPAKGLSSVLPALTGLRGEGQVRIGTETADRVAGVLAGTALPAVLPDTDPSKPVQVTVDVIPSSHQVRRIVLVGPFDSAADSTYTVTLTGYGEPLHITPPSS